jgi:hypothetical protein
MMKYLSTTARTPWLLAAVLLSGICTVAQTATSPAADDPILYLLYLRQHDALCRRIESARTLNVTQAETMEQAAATEMHLRRVDMPKVRLVYQHLAAALAKIDHDADAYRDSVLAAKTAPDPATLSVLSGRRTQAIAAAVSELEATLDPTAWKEVKAFVEGPFRKGVVTRRAGQ